MSELMIPIPFKELMTWMTAEYDRDKTVFGVHRPYISRQPPGAGPPHFYGGFSDTLCK